MAALLALVVGGCGGGGTVEEASEAVAGLIASDDCLRVLELSGSLPRALGGAVSSGSGADAQFLADFATRAPSEIAGDIAVARRAVDALARGEELAAPEQASARTAAVNLGTWARSSCPG